jgi:hypothetical protein
VVICAAWLISDVGRNSMRTAFIVIGLVFMIGGAAALARPSSMTLFPSGSKWRQPVEVSADAKRVYGCVALVFGAGFLLAGARRGSSHTKKEDVSGAPREDRI